MTEKVKNRLNELWSRDYRALRNMEPEAAQVAYNGMKAAK